MLLRATVDFCALRPLRAGGVLIRTRYGLALRNNAIPIHKFSLFSQHQRIAFYSAVNLFKSLTGSQITQWNEARFNYTWYTPCGESYNPETFELFASINTSAAALNQHPFLSPPIPNTPPGYFGFSILECTDHSLVVRNLLNAVPIGMILCFAAGPPTYSPNSDNLEKYTQIGFFPYGTLQSFSIFNEYFARHGQPIAGMYVKLAARYYDIASGLFSPYSYNSKMPA